MAKLCFSDPTVNKISVELNLYDTPNVHRIKDFPTMMFFQILEINGAKILEDLVNVLAVLEFIIIYGPLEKAPALPSQFLSLRPSDPF